MRPHLDISHEGTLSTDDRVRMRFDEDSISHLMSVLTDLYSDPQLAVIREYSTNAYDSHIAAGNTAPIEVELPTHLRPMYVVVDHGVGMSLDMITQNFSRYGWSSKRDTDDAVGMLGLGCKSALTYSSQFTLTSVHDGLRIVTLVTREADGGGAVQIIDTSATDAPNGVTVEIPVKNVTSFTAAAKGFFRFWEPGTVLVDGAAPEPLIAIELDPDLQMVTTDVLPRDYVIMGNVAYPVLAPFERLAPNEGVSIVARVPIGTVNFTPSREALQDTKRSRETLSDIRDYVSRRMYEQVQEEINKATTPVGAYQQFHLWKKRVPKGAKLSWRGESIPAMVYLAVSAVRWTTGRRSDSEKVASVAPDGATNYTHVLGFRGSFLSASAKEKATELLGADVRLLFHRADLPYWLEGAPIVQWDDIHAVKLANSGPRVKKKPLMFKVVNSYGRYTPVDKLDGPACWIQTKYPADRAKTAGLLIEEGIHLVMVDKVGEGRFRREQPAIPHVSEVIQDLAVQASAALTPAETAVVAGNLSSQRWSLTADRLHDQSLADYVRSVRSAYGKEGLARRDRAIRLRRAAADFGQKLPALDLQEFGKERMRLLKLYPLLDEAEDREGTIEYVNAMYFTRTMLTPATALDTTTNRE